ncbi:MAG TPA: metal ABC transporter permease [Candidatus Limnocylindria bacterium]
MDWLTDPLGLELFRRALLEAMVMGATCGAIGAYVVLRRLAFIGDALSHAVFPGVVLAYVAGVPIFLGAMLAGTITSLAIAVVSRGQRIREDTAIGIFFAGAFALGIVLISTQSGYQRDLSAFLVGDLLGVGWDDIAVSVLAGGGVIGILVALRKELLLVSFDRTYAQALGYPVFALELLLLLLLTATIVVSLSAVGIILVLSMLVTPAATARLLVDRFTPMMALGGVLGAVYGVIGWYVSYHLAWSPGGSIVLVATMLFLAAFVFSPSHGVLAHRLRRHPQHDAQRAAVDQPTGHQHGENEGAVVASLERRHPPGR